MTGIDECGFLSDQISDWIKKHRNANAEYFNLCEDVSKYCQKVMLSLEVHKKNLPEVLVASLLVRTLSNFQGMILLAERGMINESKALLRCLLEGMFAIVAIGLETNFAFDLVNNDLFEQRRVLIGCLELKHLNNEQRRYAKEKLIDVKKEIKEKNIKKITTKNIAEKSGLLDFYNSAYRVLSGTIHASIRDLQQYLKVDLKGKIDGLLWGPDIDDIDFILLTGIEDMLYILEGVFQVFSIKDKDEFESLSKRFKSIYELFITKEEK